MSVRSRWLFILVGNNQTGKTTIQRKLVELLNGHIYLSLPSNQAYPITHNYFARKFRKFFIAGRSYQELLGQGQNPYRTVEEYFQKLDAAGPDVDVAFMASHLDAGAIEALMMQARRRYWNVCGIFLTNVTAANPDQCAAIGELAWDERWLAANPATPDENTQGTQLHRVAEVIVQMLIERTRGWWAPATGRTSLAARRS